MRPVPDLSSLLFPFWSTSLATEAKEGDLQKNPEYSIAESKSSLSLSLQLGGGRQWAQGWVEVTSRLRVPSTGH